MLEAGAAASRLLAWLSPGPEHGHQRDTDKFPSRVPHLGLGWAAGVRVNIRSLPGWRRSRAVLSVLSQTGVFLRLFVPFLPRHGGSLVTLQVGLSR